jgi:hypothetical protein
MSYASYVRGTEKMTADYGGCVRVLPIVLETAGGSVIDSFGTIRDFLAFNNPGYTLKNSVSKQEFNEFKTAHGKIIKSLKVSEYVGTDGQPTSAASEGGDTFKFDIVVTKEDIKWLQSLLLNSTPVIIAFPTVREIDGVIPAWNHLLCKLQGNVDFQPKEGVGSITVSFEGGAAHTDSDSAPQTYTSYNTAMTTATMTPFGVDSATTFDIAALADAADWTALKSGRVVIKDVP